VNDTRPTQIKAHHLERLALVYLRQSSPKQVEMHTGSTAHQRDQKEYALQWGWPEAAIEVIDEDLGLSGTSGDHRRGWQRMLKLVPENEVGVIFVSDISRLSRSRRDYGTLADLCREFGVLLVVNGDIVDFNNPHDTFMMNIRADVAEYDTEVRKNTLMKAKLAKARQGHAVSPCPTGYIREKGKWYKDPDQSVQQAIETVFRQYQVLGTLGKVLQFLVDDDHRLQLPIRRSTGALDWRKPSRFRIRYILTNPAFAGYYVYGRRPLEKGSSKDKRRRTDWRGSILIENHHEAYLPPAEWLQIIERLEANRLTVRQPAGAGPALLQGLIRCGRCTHRMRTLYHVNAQQVGISYVCDHERVHYGAPLCWKVNGNRLDEVVVAELFRGLTPPSIENVLAATEDVNATYEALRQQRETDLARVRYEAHLAEERFKRVDPANRLVGASLERELELALAKVREVERHQAERPVAPPLEVTPESLEAIRRAAADLPRLWAAPATTDEDRKLVIRAVVREVRIVASSAVDFEAEIEWVGGATTRHRIDRPFAGSIVARELAAQGLDVVQIAAALNERGLRTVSKGRAFTAVAVRTLLRYHGWKAKNGPPPWLVYRERLRAPLTELIAAGWTDEEIAAEFARRGLRGFHGRKPWKGAMIRDLRYALGIPSGYKTRVRLHKAHVHDMEPLRGPLTERVQAGWTDAAIAEDFNRRELPRWGYRTTWNRTRVRFLRYALGIPSGRKARMRLHKTPPPPWRKDESDDMRHHPEPAGAQDGLGHSEPGARVLGADGQQCLPQQSRPHEQ
jgi:DNA invertase Pin-like site-specific DNA recombinase